LVSLTWLFAAVFTDATTIIQSADDKSLVDETRSSYYDVVQAQEAGKQLASFGLFTDELVWSVSLIDGHFECNGYIFSAQPVSSPKIPLGGKFKLVFFRDHQQDVIVSSDGSMKNGEHRIAYRFGWEYEVKGKVWEQTLVIS
jgi:hypothetical protein